MRTYTCIHTCVIHLSLSIYIYILYIYIYIRIHIYIYIYMYIHMVHVMRSNPNARNAIPSQSFSLKRKCLITSARGSLYSYGFTNETSTTWDWRDAVRGARRGLGYGRFPKFHRVFLGRDPGTLKSDIVSKKHPQLICSDLRLSNCKIRRLTFWKPTVPESSQRCLGFRAHLSMTCHTGRR